MSNTSDIEEGEIPDQESLAIPTSSKNSKPIPKRKPDRPYDSDSSASSEQASSDDSDNEWWDRKKVKGEKGSQDSDNEDSDGDVIEITEANPNYFKKGNWKSKRDFNRDDINARKGFHKKKMGAMQDKVGFKRTFQAAKANRRAFPPGSPPKVAMYPCKFYIVFGKCDDPNCKNVHAPLTRDDEMQRFIAENEEFFADIAKRRQELNLSGFLLKLLTDKFGPPQPQIGNPPPNFGMNRPLPPPKAQMQPAPYLPPSQGPPPMGNFNNYPPGSNFPNMPARPPGIPHQGPPPSYMPPQNGPQPMMHNMPPQDPRFGQNPNMPPRNPGFDYPPQPQQNFAFAPTYRPPNPNPNPNQMFGNQFQQEPKLNFGQEQINYPPQNNQGYDYNQGHNQGHNQGLNQGPPPHAQQQHGNFNPYQPQYPQQQHQQQQPQQPPVNMNQMNRAPGQEESQSGFMNPPIPGAGNMGPPNVGVQGQGTFMMPTNNYQVEPRFQDQNIFSNVGNFPAQVQQSVQHNPQTTGNNGLQEGQGAVKGSSPTETKGAVENEEEPKRAAMNDIEKFNEKMKNFGILNFGGSGTGSGSGNVEKEDTKADEELQRQIKEAIREETKGADGAGLSGNISINDQILKQIKSVLPQFQSQSPDNIKNLVNIYLKLSKDPRLQNRIQS